MHLYKKTKCCGSVIKPDQNVQISASPPAVEEGVTPHLTIKCAVAKPASKISLLSIILSRQPLQGNQEAMELASISSFDGGQVKNIDNTVAVLSGAIAAHDASFISMSYSRPSRNETGLYTCRANLMDELGHPQTSFSDVLVQEETSQLQTYASLVQGLSSQVQGAASCCANLSSSVADLEQTAKRLTIALDYVQTNLMFEMSSAYRGKVYYYSKYSVDGIDAAESSCEIMGGFLAEIQDSAEWTFVSTLLKNAAGKFPSRNVTLLGAQDSTAEGSWFWTHSKSPVTFTAWESGSPNDVNHTENCLGATFTGTKASWIDVSCDVSVTKIPSQRPDTGFLCEVPA
ncbi:C-type lectin [Plakobranchus ocellatus]|uniref:C-type lectin n=1 Tax=Plakobranchus ocellatus TaxID=259542 RepID=A0AAV4B3D3_9GAST|nr:C-type lectin [Plakobranchus ocellatus]